MKYIHILCIPTDNSILFLKLLLVYIKWWICYSNRETRNEICVLCIFQIYRISFRISITSMILIWTLFSLLLTNGQMREWIGLSLIHTIPEWLRYELTPLYVWIDLFFAQSLINNLISYLYVYWNVPWNTTNVNISCENISIWIMWCRVLSSHNVCDCCWPWISAWSDVSVASTRNSTMYSIFYRKRNRSHYRLNTVIHQYLSHTHIQTYIRIISHIIFD